MKTFSTTRKLKSSLKSHARYSHNTKQMTMPQNNTPPRSAITSTPSALAAYSKINKTPEDKQTNDQTTSRARTIIAHHQETMIVPGIMTLNNDHQAEPCHQMEDVQTIAVIFAIDKDTVIEFVTHIPMRNVEQTFARIVEDSTNLNAKHANGQTHQDQTKEDNNKYHQSTHSNKTCLNNNHRTRTTNNNTQDQINTTTTNNKGHSQETNLTNKTNALTQETNHTKTTEDHFQETSHTNKTGHFHDKTIRTNDPTTTGSTITMVITNITKEITSKIDRDQETDPTIKATVSNKTETLTSCQLDNVTDLHTITNKTDDPNSINNDNLGTTTNPANNMVKTLRPK